MATIVEVPLNTMLADLDETLRALLKRDLGRHGFDGVEIAFEAPDKEWSASLSTPTVNLFLYDIREARDVRPIEWQLHHPPNGNAHELRPPLRVDASYAVTAWTRAVEDEHRLLSQVLATLYAHPELAADLLVGTLANGSQQYPLSARVAQERMDDKADFWTSVGGQFKASVDYVVTLSCESGTFYERGPEVRTQTVRTADVDGGKATLQEWHRIGGTVKDEDGAPVGDAWVVMDKAGWTATDADGRFRFARLEAGTYKCVARGPNGLEAEAEVVVPGRGVDLTLAKRRPAKRRS